MQDILINWAPQETRVAIVENGAVQELHLERTLERGLLGNIYLGKVARVLPGMQSAFIDIGLERAAFLHVADLHGAVLDDGHARLLRRPVDQDVLHAVRTPRDQKRTRACVRSRAVSYRGKPMIPEWLPSMRAIQPAMLLWIA